MRYLPSASLGTICMHEKELAGAPCRGPYRPLRQLRRCGAVKAVRVAELTAGGRRGAFDERLAQRLRAATTRGSACSRQRHA